MALALLNSISARSSLLILNILSVRLLSTQDYGRYIYYLGIASGLAAVSTLGAGTSANIYFARNSERTKEASDFLFSNALLTTALSIIITAAFVPFVSFDKQTAQAPTAMLLAAFVLLMSLGALMEGALNGLRDYFTLAVNGAISLVASCLFALAMIVLVGYWGAMLSLLFYRLLSFALNSWRLRRSGFLEARFTGAKIWDPASILAFKKVGLPTMLGSLMVGPVVAASLTSVAASPGGMTEVAYFGWTQQIYAVAVFIPSALGGFFITKMTRSEGASEIVKIILGNVAFAIIMAIIIFVCKTPLLSIAGYQDSLRAGLVYDLMNLTIVLYAANAAFASFWPTKGHAWAGFGLNAIWASVLLITTIHFAPTHGAAALAAGFLAAYGVQLIFQTLLFANLKVRYNA